MIKTLAISVGLALTFAASAADPTYFYASLTHDQEAVTGPLVTSTGAPRPLSFGLGTFILNPEMTQLSMSVDIFNIDVTGSQTPNDSNDNLVNAHIHAGPGATPTFPVVWGFFGSPDNDDNPDNLVVTPFANGVGGTFTSIWDLPEGNNTTLAGQLPNILSEHSYVNFHTVQFGGGEIRGTLLRVPDATSTLPLLGGGLVGLVLARRRFSVAA